MALQNRRLSGFGLTRRRRNTRNPCRRASSASVEQLENRIALSVSAFEQEFIYLLNRARHDPAAYQAERGLSINLSSITPRQPLALNLQLAAAGKFKSDEMATLNYFAHTSVTGETPNALVRRFGYDLPERVSVGDTTYLLPATGNMVESLHGGRTTPAAALQSLIESTGHRNHLLGVTAHNQVAKEVGIGYRFSSQAFYKHYWTVLITPSNATRPFLTGVAFADGNNNDRFEGVEGLGNVTVTASGPNGIFMTTSGITGGWALSVPSGDYVVTASGGGFSGTSSAPVRVGSQNVAVDFISGSSAASVSFIPHVNSAPVLMTDEDRFFAPVIVGSQNPRGQTVGNLLGTDFTDVDPLSQSGVAVTATTVASGGSWQFSIDGGGSWQSLGTPSTGAARLLRSADMLRFVPGDSAPATASLSYRAWDQTTGSAGGFADVSNAGGSTAFSTATATANVHVVSSNTAPVLSFAGTNPFDSVAEDTIHPPGSPIRHLVGSGFSDPDPGTPVGIAVIDATDDTNGDWQYSLDEGATWSVLGTVSSGATLLLSGSSRLRFLPVANYNGTVTLSYRAWDASTGGAGDRVDLSGASAVGGSTGFSSEAVTASLTVTPVNDAPVFIADASALRLRPVPANATQNEALAIGTRVGDLLGNAHRDIDASPLRGIAIIGTGGNGTFWWNTGSGGWSGIAAGPHFATLLRETDYIYFSPSSGFSGTSTVTFRLWDQTSGNQGWNGADLSNPGTSTGGSTAFGTEILEARVFVGAAGTPPSATFGNPTRDESGRVVASIPLSLSRAVSGLDSGDLTLSRDGTPVALHGARVEGSGASLTVAGLEDATTIPGTYILRLVATGSGITDEAGNPLSSDASVTFVVAGNQSTTPSAPTDLSATAGNAQANLTWTAPSSNGGASITDYIVQYSSDSGSTWTTFDRAASTATSATVTGLTNGTAYLFRVAAVNSVGMGAYSLPSTAIGRVVEVADGQVVSDTTVRTGDYRMIKRGLGTLILDLANTHAGGTIVEAGEVIVRNPLSLGSGSLVVQAGAKLRLDIGTGRVSLPALTLAGTGTLDLGTGSLVISAGGFDLAGLRESIISGRNNGTWAGRGITSSGIQPGTSREVGYRVLRDGSLLVGYSAVGDTNMDGSVNIQDLIEISTSGKYGSGSADAAWWQGDFNYDGVVNITDLINLSTSELYGAGSYMPVTAAGAVSPQPLGSSFGSPLAGLTATPTGYTAQADLEPAATPAAIELADQMPTAPSSPRQAAGRQVVGRLAWAAIANQGVLESPKDAKAARWWLVAR
jgi:autotransporter-associated beta strand protein